MKANLFLGAGAARRLTGSELFGQTGGLWRQRPWFSLLFLIPALSLAGVPPFSGFWAKLLLAKATLDAGRYGLTFAVLGVGLLTLFAMARLWSEVFWAPHPLGDACDRGPAAADDVGAAPRADRARGLDRRQRRALHRRRGRRSAPASSTRPATSPPCWEARRDGAPAPWYAICARRRLLPRPRGLEPPGRPRRAAPGGRRRAALRHRAARTMPGATSRSPWSRTTSP